MFSRINKSVVINIATPGWNEYEEKVNYSPQSEADPKGEGEIQSGVCYYLDYSPGITALVLSLLFPQRRLLKAHYKFAVILDRYIST